MLILLNYAGQLGFAEKDTPFTVCTFSWKSQRASEEKEHETVQ